MSDNFYADKLGLNGPSDPPIDIAFYEKLKPWQFEAYLLNERLIGLDLFGLSAGGVHYAISGSLVREHQKTLNNVPAPLKSYPIQFVHDSDVYQRVLEKHRLDALVSLGWCGLVRQSVLVVRLESKLAALSAAVLRKFLKHFFRS